MTESSAPPVVPAEADVDTIVDGYVDEILDLLDEFPEEHGEHVDTAVFTCSVQRAVDARIPKDEFLAMMEEMYEESREMGELEDRMSLTRGQA